MRTLVGTIVLLAATLFVVAPTAHAQSYGAGYASGYIAPHADTTPQSSYGFGFCPPHPLTFANAGSGWSYGWWPTMGYHYGYWAPNSPPSLAPASMPAD